MTGVATSDIKVFNLRLLVNCQIHFVLELIVFDDYWRHDQARTRIIAPSLPTLSEALRASTLCESGISFGRGYFLNAGVAGLHCDWA